MREFEQSNVDKSTLEFSFKIRKGAVSGPINIYTPFDESFEFEAKLSKKAGGEYQSTPYRMPRQNFCEYFKTDSTGYEDVAKFSDIPKNFDCPFAIVS